LIQLLAPGIRRKVSEELKNGKGYYVETSPLFISSSSSSSSSSYYY
jgi:hypothetical protein